MNHTGTARRSLLFVPANRPELFAKALATSADIVCIDLEDGVSVNHKESARGQAIEFMADAAAGGPERLIRINSPRTRAGLLDLANLVDARLTQGTVMLPKVESQEEILWVDGLLNEAALPLGLAAIIESTRGVENAFAIAGAASRMELVMFGGGDLAAELGTPIAPVPLAYGRTRVVYAAHSVGIDVFDMPCLDFQDHDIVRREAEDAHALGFTGKAVIHPTNVETVNKVFTPTAEELKEAQRVLAAFHRSQTGVAVLDGKIVERPIVRGMEKTLARGRAAGLAT